MHHRLQILRDTLRSFGQVESADQIDEMIERTAVVITGNPKYVKNNPEAERFYRELVSYLEGRGFSTTMDTGKPFTSPPRADLWIGHSMGADRLGGSVPEYARFAIALGIPDTESFGNMGDNYFALNHPEDQPSPGQEPTKEHFIFTDEMKFMINNISKNI